MFYVLLWAIRLALPHALHLKKQVMRLLGKRLLRPRIFVPKGSGGGVACDFPEKTLLLADEVLVLIIADFLPTNPVAIFWWLARSDFEYFIVFAEGEELYLLLGEVVKVDCKLTKQYLVFLVGKMRDSYDDLCASTLT